MGGWLWSRSVAAVCPKPAFTWCSGLGCASLETKRPSVCRANVRTKGRGGGFRCRHKPYAAASSRPTSHPPGGGAARAHAGDQIRIGVGEVSAAVLTDDVEARDAVALGVDGVHVRVDLDAVERAERIAGVLDAVERSLFKRRKTEGLLAEVFVDAFGLLRSRRCGLVFGLRRPQADDRRRGEGARRMNFRPVRIWRTGVANAASIMDARRQMPRGHQPAGHQGEGNKDKPCGRITSVRRRGSRARSERGARRP